MSSEDFDMNDSTWMSADPHLASSLSPSQDERMRSPQNLHSQEDGEYPWVAGGGGPAPDTRSLGIQRGGIWARLTAAPQPLYGPHGLAPGFGEAKSFLPKIRWMERSGNGSLTGIVLVNVP